MKNITVLLVIIHSFYVESQAYQWAFGIEGIDGIVTKKIVQEPTGKLLVMGDYRSYYPTIDLDPSTNTYPLEREGGSDIFVAKYELNNDLIWGFRIAGLYDDRGHSIYTDTDGNIFVVGDYVGEITFYDTDTTAFYHFSSSYNGTKGFIAKYSSDGDFLWANFIEGENGSTASGGAIRAVTTDAFNTIYITGEMYGNEAALITDQDTLVLNTTGRTDLFLAAIAPNGLITWGFLVGGTSTYYGDIAYDIIHKDAQLYLCGTVSAFYQEVDFNPLGVTNSFETHVDNSAFVAKYDILGNCLWANPITGEDAQSFAYDMDIDLSGNVYLTGEFKYASDFDPSSEVDSIVSFGCNDIFVSKYNSLGEYSWGFHAGSENCDNIGFGIDVEGSDLYLTGEHSTYSSIGSDFDPSDTISTGTHSSYGYSDIFAARYDTDMNFYWAMSIGVSDYELYAKDQGMAILGLPNGMTYIGGGVIGEADFDITANEVILAPVNYINAYVAAYDGYTILPSQNLGLKPLGTTTNSNVIMYPNPAHENLEVLLKNNLTIHSIHIFNLSGESINNFRVNNNTAKISIDYLESGVYFIEIKDENGNNHVEKLIVD